MDAEMQKLEEWLTTIREYEPPNWDRLPELDLYMDQVITFLNKLLAPFAAENERPLTSSMINNYVKAGVLPRPDRKKYAREHLAILTMICMLKSSLSIPDISLLVSLLLETCGGKTEEGKQGGEKEMYSRFCDAQKLAMEEVCDRLQERIPGGREELLRLAGELSIEAAMRRAAAERILGELSRESSAEKQEE